MLLSNARACLAVALMLASARHGSAQSPPQSPPPQTPPPTTAGVQAKPEQAPPTAQPVSRKRKPRRTSKRQPAASGQGSFEENRPSRVAGPTRKELTLSGNLLGGYDDNLTAGLGTGGGTSPTAMASGSTASADASLGYFHGNTLRSIQMNATGSLVGYPGYLEHPAPGGVADVAFRTTLGRSMTLRASDRVGYEPLFNVFPASSAVAPMPPGTGQTPPATGLFERRSLNSNASVSLDRWWNGRNSTSLSYSYNAQQFTDDNYGDSSAHNVQAEYRRGLTRGVRARAAYRFVDRDYSAYDGLTLPTREHRIEGGPDIQSTLSRRRSLTVSLAAGASYVESVGATSHEPYQQWVPVGSASVRVNLSPLWSVEGGYRREFSQFQGVTDEVYSTDTAFLTTGGLVTSRTDLRIGGTYSNWKTLFASGVNDTLNVYGGSLQLRVSLTATVSASAAYYYYYHRYSNPAGLPAGFPVEYDRNAFRVGLAVWVPLVGASSRPPLTQR
jgi:hypothetical protein